MYLYKKLFITVICLFSVSSLFSQDLIIENGETMEYQIVKKNGSKYKSKTTYSVFELNNETVYSYLCQDKFATWDVVTDVDAAPKNITYDSNGNKMKLIFNDTGKVKMTGVWNGNMIDLEKTFNKTITLENALVLRSLDFNNPKEYVFDLLQTSEFPNLKSFKMYFKVIGDETVVVKAGTFKCKKVLFSIKGMGGLFYKAYYYISDDEHRYIVKMENMPMDSNTELENIYIGPLDE